MSNNEHAHNIDAKLTNHLQNVHIFNALKENKPIEFNLCLCIVHYALKEISELCRILMSNNEHACNTDAKFTHNA